MKIRSPLRYPGGKTRAIKSIDPQVPNFIEYREPFIGGGSVFAHIKQTFDGEKHWINDLNYDVYLFWKYAKDNNEEFVNKVKRIKNGCKDGKKLYNYYKGNWDEFFDIERAVRFFILNRITFSGTIDSGGYSEESFQKRFTESSINRLAKLEDLLTGTKITNVDFEDVVKEPGEDVFLFLDPPYYSISKSKNKSKFYGKNGKLHSNFDHERFASIMKNCDHKWLITYDDCKEVRELFDFAQVIPWSLQYGMNNYGQETADKGKELFILNYSE